MRKSEEKKNERQNKVVFPPFFLQNVCNLVWKQASWAKKGTKATKTSREQTARLVPKRKPPSSNNFFSSLRVFGESKLGVQVFCGRDELMFGIIMCRCCPPDDDGRYEK